MLFTCIFFDVFKIWHYPFFEPSPGEYEIIKKTLITQCATRYKDNYSVGAYVSAGDSVFIHKVEQIDAHDGILFRGQLRPGSWITLDDKSNNQKYAKLKVIVSY